MRCNGGRGCDGSRMQFGFSWLGHGATVARALRSSPWCNDGDTTDELGIQKTHGFPLDSTVQEWRLDAPNSSNLVSVGFGMVHQWRAPEILESIIQAGGSWCNCGACGAEMLQTQAI